ncbi:MAG: DoxX family protein [Planctomycetota bacterium]|nr:DoxX family protein [Planctomycetota bacterium]
MKNVPKKSTPALIATWGAQLVAAGILGYAGYLKLADHQADIELFTQLGMEPAGRYIIGGLELLAATLMLIPQSAVYGAILGLGVMLGAIIGHLTALGIDVKLLFALLVAALCVVVIVIRRFDAEFLRNLWDHYRYDVE